MEVFKKLINEFKAQSEEIIKNKTSLEEELETVLKVNKEEKEILEARVKVFERKVEDALAEGDSEGAEKYRQKVEETRSTIKERKAYILALTEELNGIDAEVSKIAKKVLQSLYPEIQKEVFASWLSAIETTENAWEDIKAFGNETGALISSLYGDNLAIRDHKPHQELYKRLHKWV